MRWCRSSSNRRCGEPAFLFDVKPTVAYNMRYTFGTSVEELNGDQFFRAENPPYRRHDYVA